MGFGFPNERHLRLTVKLGIAWRIGEVHELKWHLNADRPAPSLGWFWQSELVSGKGTLSDAPDNTHVSDLHILEACVNQSWARMQQDPLSLNYAFGQRNWQQFKWRYLQRPDKRYQFVVLRRPWSSIANPSSACHGIAVLSAPAEMGRPMMWLDWIGPLKLMSTAHRMVMNVAQTQRASCVLSWASAEVEKSLTSTQVDAIATCAAMGVPIASDLTAEQAQNLRWWAMAGDTDFL